MGVSTRIEDLRVVLGQAMDHRVHVLKSMARKFRAIYVKVSILTLKVGWESLRSGFTYCVYFEINGPTSRSKERRKKLSGRFPSEVTWKCREATVHWRSFSSVL